MLRRLRIKNYKSFRELDLEMRRLMVVMGPNASGKSNLLDAIQLLSRLVSSRNVSEAFRNHRGLPLESVFYADHGYEELLNRERASFRFEVDLELSEDTVRRVERIIQSKRRGLGGNGRKHVTERYLRYEIEVEVLPSTGHVRVLEEKALALTRTGKPKVSRNPFLEKVAPGRLHLRIEGQSRPYYRDVGMEHTVLSESLYEPHFPHLAALRTELESCMVFYLEPRALMREEVPRKEVNSIGQRGEDLAAFLNMLKSERPNEFDNLQKTVETMLPGRPRMDVELTKDGRVTLVLEEGGIRYSSRLISEGTLRVIGLLAAVHRSSPATTIGYEEPENGVHPARLRLIADVLRSAVKMFRKQVIVTTHSPLFAEQFEADNLYICRREGPETKVQPFEDFGPLFRREGIRASLADLTVQGHLGG